MSQTNITFAAVIRLVIAVGGYFALTSKQVEIVSTTTKTTDTLHQKMLLH